MKPRLLMVISSDPRASARPAEAVRIAAGVSAWQKVEVSLYAHAAAVLVLGEAADQLSEGRQFLECLPVLLRNQGQIYAQNDSEHLAQVAAINVPFQRIGKAELSRLCARSRWVMRF